MQVWNEPDESKQHIRLLNKNPNQLIYIKLQVIMVALWNRADHYIFALWFLLSIWPPCVADADIIIILADVTDTTVVPPYYGHDRRVYSTDPL